MGSIGQQRRFGYVRHHTTDRLRQAESHSEPRILRIYGAIAQLGERLLCKQEVTGSIPVGSIQKYLQ
jgi:hypothetical protein